MTTSRHRYLIIAAVAAICVLGLHLLSLGRIHHQLLNSFSGRHHSKLVFPASFPLSDLSDVVQKNSAFAGILASPIRAHPQLQAVLQALLETEANGEAPFSIYAASEDPLTSLEMCSARMLSGPTIGVHRKKPIAGSITEHVLRLLKEMEHGTNPVLQEVKSYLVEQTKLQLLYDVVEHFWFRMAGSSVYLEDYGYHLVVSRLAYSAKGLRNNPKFSFVYAQIFDSNWNELTDINLVVPTNLKKGDRFFTAEDQSYAIVHYPTIMEVPFFHDVEDRGKLYLGPEDARIIMVKNKANYTEPLLIYNLDHQKIVRIDDDEDDEVFGQVKLQRTMWVSWPWQFQRGKANVLHHKDIEYAKNLYCRLHELKIKNADDLGTQKNWTPFFSEEERKADGYDRNVYFVYRWSNLQILKCDITSPRGKCGLLYSAVEDLKLSTSIGPMRGGTPLLSVNKLIGNNEDLHTRLLPEGKEMWVGFARAHLSKCGCGNDFYRPNFVVLVKENVKNEKGETKTAFKLSHVSAFSLFNVETIPWDPFKPFSLCTGTNAIIPNGISQWVMSQPGPDEDVTSFNDALILAVSVSDATVDLVRINNVLKTLVESIIDPKPKPKSKPKPTKESEASTEGEKASEGDEHAEGDKSTEGDEPTEVDSAGKHDATLDYQSRVSREKHFTPRDELNVPAEDSNLFCAMAASEKYCQDYGYTFEQLDKETIERYWPIDIDKVEERLALYSDALFDRALELY